MKLEDIEAHELLERLFTEDDAELIVGQPEGLATNVWFVAIPKSGGGIATKSLTPRSAMLVRKLLDLAPVEEATPEQAKAIAKIVDAANNPAPFGTDEDEDDE